MRYDRTDASFIQISELICPDCGGKLLRGPRAGWYNHNLTCRDCKNRINTLVVFHPCCPHLRSQEASGGDMRPRTDKDFIARAVVLGWEVIGPDLAGAAFYDPAYPKLLCPACDQPFTGPGIYCCLACAIDDA